MPAPMIIDAHMHIYRSRDHGLRNKQGYDIWEYGSRPDVNFSRATGTLEEAAHDMDRAGISRAVVVNLFAARRARQDAIAGLPDELDQGQREQAIKDIDSSMGQRIEEFNVWGCGLARGNPRLVPYISADPWALPGEEGPAHIQRMVGRHGARGIKLHPVVQEFHMSDRRMWPIYQACQELGLPIIAHSGPARGAVQYGEPRAFAEALGAFPRLTLVLAHMGGGAWQQALEIAQAFPNAYFDCCEIMEWTGGPNAPSDRQLAQLIKDVGPERVLMGSDFPWYDLDHSVQRVMELPLLAREEKEAILGANAARILGL